MRKEFLFLLLLMHKIETRSIFRPEDPRIPKVAFSWSKDNKSYILKDHLLKEKPIFRIYDENFFKEHLLPKGKIAYRNKPEKNISGEELSKIIEKLLEEIQKRKSQYSDFVILKNRDFNVKKRLGLLIVKFKKYPFVLKLFKTSPKDLATPYSKGFIESQIFRLNGATRYFLGFTRIKHLEEIKIRLKNHPFSSIVDLPRKWYWQPKHNDKIHILGENFKKTKMIEIDVPEVYGIIVDAITRRSNPICHDYKDETILDICNYLDLDANSLNFLTEAETNKLVLIDTEHVPTLLGLKKTEASNSYITWYMKVALRAVDRNAFHSKKLLS